MNQTVALLSPKAVRFAHGHDLLIQVQANEKWFAAPRGLNTLLRLLEDGKKLRALVESPAEAQALAPEPPPRWRAGWLFRWGSLWVGGHWSPKNRRLCINFVPFVTLWITPPGGKTP